MEKLFHYLAVAFLLIGLVKSTCATHVMGGEITYKNLGSNKLEITVSVYRDCNGIALSNSPLQARSDSGSYSFTLNKVSVIDITGINPNCPVQSRCKDTATYGIEEHIFRDTIDMSALKGCKFVFSWMQCCRNANISTGAANHNYYMETTYNKCLTPNNSSPSFLSYPVLLLGRGHDISVSHTAVDTVDNDEITYELTEPLSAQGSKIGYSGSWNVSRPLTFLGYPNAGLNFPAGFRFDSLTSNMSFRPTITNQSTVISIKVKEWRKINGIRTQISETHRDIQLIIINVGNNNAPRIDNTFSSVVKACTPGTYCVTIPIEDKDTSDTLSIQVKHNFKNLTYTKDSISPNKINLKVCYTVDSNVFNNSGSYYFKIIAEDGACPFTVRSEKTYFFRRDSAQKIVIPSLPLFCENDSPILLQTSPNFGTWSGSGISGSTFSPSLAGKGIHNIVYSFKDSITGCSNKDSVWVRVLQQPKASFTANKNIGLSTDTFKFTNTTTADTTFLSLWNMGQNGAVGNLQNSKDASHVYNDSGKFIISLIVNNGVCKADSAQDTVVLSFPLSLKKLPQTALKLYPNPTKDLLTVEIGEEIASLTLTDALGKVIKVSSAINGTKAQIKVDTLLTGVYLIEAKDIKGKTYTGKVQISR
jgi:hypothetical protein